MLAGIAGIFALLTLAFDAVTGMFLLDLVLPIWASALIVTLTLLAVTLVVGLFAYSQFKQITVAPKKTIDSVHEDVRWARDRMNFNGRSSSTGGVSMRG